MSPAKTAELIEMPFGLRTRVGPRNNVVGDGAEMELDLRVTGHWVSDFGRVTYGLVSDPVFDGFEFNICVYRGVVTT